MLQETRCQKRSCRHYRGVSDGPEVQTSDDEPAQVHYCAAFPAGIPPEIAYGDDLHASPRPDDRGIQYERGRPTLFAPIPSVDDDARDA